jgi:Fur family ferric uptake transcriptional regulator
MSESEQLRARLHERGLRVTPQRQLVLDAIDRLGHATPDAIAAEVERRAPGVNISTVYRTLELLESLELVRHAHLGPGAPTYHAAGDHAHLHLVCHGCGTVTEAEIGLAAELAGRVRAAYGFTLDVEHMAISGWCPDCAR